jgi:myo-inositol-1(or 4)-monophosphatase
VTPPAVPLSAEAAFGSLGPDTDPELAELARVAVSAAQDAAALLAAGFGARRKYIDTKSSATDMVSEVDRAAETLITDRLRELRPADGLLGEEGADIHGSSGVRWVIDPLDGTTNYLFGIPVYSVSIAAEIAGAAVVGVVIDPSRNETWAAIAGGGAWRNGEAVRVASGRSQLDTALVGTGFAYRAERRAWQASVAAQVIPAVRDLRRFGSAALDLCWVAGGRLDAYYEWGLNPWDLSAGELLCREAGGLVEILPGRTVLAATPALMSPLRDLLEAAGAFLAPDGPEPKAW